MEHMHPGAELNFRVYEGFSTLGGQLTRLCFVACTQPILALLVHTIDVWLHT
jgi:hypothetical protein